MSQTEKVLHAETIIASGAVTARRLVGFDGAQATVTGAKVMGPAVNDAADGEPVAVNAIGSLLVESGAAVAVGADIVTDTQGRAITNPAVGGEYIVGQAVTAVSGAGILVRVLFK
ncbi:MAG: DUF2190 family protein [Methylocystaceae bacterium]|nr:DUF2190 family protein [Methylocystaceae bacterium]